MHKLILIVVMCLPISVMALDASKAERLRSLISLDIEQLGEVDVKLDDVFDVFDGLVQQQKVTVASGRKQSTAVAPSVTSVITAQDIEASGARTLAEALRMVPGLHISTASNWRPIYVLRGIVNSTNPEVLFLLNGMVIKNPGSGNRGMFAIEPKVQNISRIEVIRGPGSAVYGADAFSGVINIITKSAQEMDGVETGVRVGSFNTSELWAMYGGRHGEVDIAASVQLDSTDGVDPMIKQDVQTVIDNGFAQAVPNYQPVSNAPDKLSIGHKSIDAHVVLSWKNWQLYLDYTGFRDRGMGLYVLHLDPVGEEDNSRYSGHLIWHDNQLADVWDVKASLSFQRWQRENQSWYNPPNTLLTDGFYPQGVIEAGKYRDRVLDVETDVFYRGFHGHVPRFGVGFSKQRATQDYFRRNQGLDAQGNPIPAGSPLVDVTGTPYSSLTLRDRKRDNWHLFIQDSWAFATGWELTFGLRYDDYSDFGSTTNPRAALVWQTTPRFTSKLLYGKAFRAPTFQEMYLNNPIMVGNRNLKPEEIESYELAFDWRASDHIYLTLSLYQFDIENKILPVSNIEKPQFLNSGQRFGRGSELELRWKLGNRSSLLFNYAYADNTVQNDNIADYREVTYPRHSAYLRLDWMFQPNWYVDMQTYWSADYARLPTDDRPEIDDNVTVDLTLRYRTHLTSV